LNAMTSLDLARVYERTTHATQEQRIRRLEGMVMILTHALLTVELPMAYKDRQMLLWMLNDMMAEMADRLR
jgi:hypothetical protein